MRSRRFRRAEAAAAFADNLEGAKYPMPGHSWDPASTRQLKREREHLFSRPGAARCPTGLRRRRCIARRSNTVGYVSISGPLSPCRGALRQRSGEPLHQHIAPCFLAAREAEGVQFGRSPGPSHARALARRPGGQRGGSREPGWLGGRLCREVRGGHWRLNPPPNHVDRSENFAIRHAAPTRTPAFRRC
jgi:hypothetical protein